MPNFYIFKAIFPSPPPAVIISVSPGSEEVWGFIYMHQVAFFSNRWKPQVHEATIKRGVNEKKNTDASPPSPFQHSNSAAPLQTPPARPLTLPPLPRPPKFSTFGSNIPHPLTEVFPAIAFGLARQLSAPPSPQSFLCSLQNQFFSPPR